MRDSNINVLIIGASYFDGMASSVRIRNLFSPLLESGDLNVYNLIYKSDTDLDIPSGGVKDKVKYSVIEHKGIMLFSLFKFIYSGIKFIRRAKSVDRTNILYSYAYIDLQNIAFILYAKVCGYRIVFDIVEDNQAYLNFPNFRSRFRHKTSLLFFNLIPVLADWVLVISNHLKLKMIKIVKNAPVELIPITVNLTYFDNRKTSVDLSNLKIFYGGSFGEKDGLEYLIEAFKKVCQKHNNVSLILTGKGLRRDVQKIEDLIKVSNVGEKISLLGFLETDDYYEMMNNSDIFCMTRINSQFANSGFPFKLGEFLATGKAVIATNVGDVSLYLDSGNAIIINPESSDEIAEAISSLIDNPTRIGLLGLEGRKIAEKYFDTHKVCLRLHQIFQNLENPHSEHLKFED